MRKLITLSDTQNALIERIKPELYQESLSGLLMALALFYEQNKKRSPGRPKGTEDTDNDEQDDIPMYVHPDKFVQGPYSYNELAVWYSTQQKPMPSRDQLQVHKYYKTNQK